MKLNIEKEGDDSLSIEHKYLYMSLDLLISSILNNNNNVVEIAYDLGPIF